MVRSRGYTPQSFHEYDAAQAYKIHGTMRPPVPEKNWPQQKIFKTKTKKKKKKKIIKNKNLLLV